MSETTHIEQVSVPIIGYHRSPLPQKFGIPRQPNLVELTSIIELVAPYNTPDAFEGIEAFSHLWLTWHTHQNNNQKSRPNSDSNPGSVNATQPFKAKVRPPRLGGNTKLGVFATRSTYRPSQLGLSVVKLLSVEVTDTGARLHISGADMVDGTPIVDIKPYIAYSDAIAEAVSGFAPDKPKVKAVQMTELAQQQFEQCLNVKSREYQTLDSQRVSDENSVVDGASNKNEQSSRLTEADKAVIFQLVAQDPRPAYKQSDTERVYVMRYKNVDIGFQMQAASGLEPDNSTMQDSPDHLLSIVSVTAL